MKIMITFLFGFGRRGWLSGRHRIPRVFRAVAALGFGAQHGR
ncbi:hypothetical protein HMPREF9607_01407 [Cutibacterium modestum HL044PA1]|uniref:Uncharacterized protein n=1 Tax=Cutibacterium modestum HL044PA1 TaxID=765109 RepID=A0ABP2K6B3_9ACTN|nr:hypothetical protein HMPREF9607_01407 [Cutibacterium modestum HL044PA1]